MPRVGCGMVNRRVHLWDETSERVTLVRLWVVLDLLAGPTPEAPTDRAVREKGERLRAAFPTVDFDHPARLSS